MVAKADGEFEKYKIEADAYYTKQQCIDLGERLKKNLESLSNPDCLKEYEHIYQVLN